MRIIVMYDLPVADAQDRHEYSRFRQFLSGMVIRGCRIPSTPAWRSIPRMLRLQSLGSRPAFQEAGLVQVLRVTEASFCSMLTLCGSPSDEGHFVTGEDFIVL